MQQSQVTPWSIVEERSGTNGETVEKRFFPQGVEILTGSESGTYTYRTDHLGSICEVVDSSGNLTARFDYSPWGEINTVSGSFDLDFGFTGHFIHQPTGLYLAPFRAYDAGLGRWLSRDPLSWAEFLPEGPNLYGYAGNNPVIWVDIYGMSITLPPCLYPKDKTATKYSKDEGRFLIFFANWEVIVYNTETGDVYRNVGIIDKYGNEHLGSCESGGSPGIPYFPPSLGPKADYDLPPEDSRPSRPKQISPDASPAGAPVVGGPRG